MATCEISGPSFVARVSYTVTQNIEKNRSSVRVTKVEIRSFADIHLNCFLKGTISVNGTQTTQLLLTATEYCAVHVSQSYTGGEAGEGSTGFKTKSLTVNHDDDGTAKIKIYANLEVIYNSAQLDYGINKTVSVNLPRIPRVSELTAASVELGQEMAIQIKRASSLFTDTVSWSCGEASGTIAEKTDGENLNWTVPLTLASQAPNGTTVGITLTLQTYTGSTLVGSRELEVRCGVPESLVPTLTVEISDKLGYLEQYGGYVQSQSMARLRTQAQGVYGSTIQRVWVSCGRLSGTGEDLSFALEESGEIAITVTVTDSRGRTASEQTSITVLPYKKPSVTITQGFRCDENGNQQPDGEWMKLTFDAEVTALPGNTAAYTGKCTVHAGEQTRSVSLTDYEGQLSVAGGSFLLSAGIDTAYDCVVSVQDGFQTVDSEPVLISVAFALLDLCRDTKAIGIGMRATSGETLSIGLKTDMTEHTIENLADPEQSQDAATKAYVDRVLKSIYPVGAIYISVSETSPAEIFGGTWERIKNRFLVGAGDKYSVGATGGADSVALTAEQLPQHSHSIGYNVVYRQSVSSGGGVRNVVAGGDASTSTGYTGSGAEHENRPPYLAVNIWKRIA